MSEMKEYLESHSIHREAIVCYLVNEETHELLLGYREFNPNGKDQKLYSGIVDVIQEDEIPEDTCFRAGQDQLGISITGMERRGVISFIFPHNPRWNHSITVFIVTKWIGEPHAAGDIAPIWFPKGNLPWNEMWHDNQFWLEDIIEGSSVNATFLYGEDNKVKEFEFFRT
jgi:8-oxo-dGTP diphosphatase